MALACGAKHQPIVDSRGKISELVTCKQHEQCLRLAERLCRLGYTIDSSRGNSLSMLVTCNEPLGDGPRSITCDGVYNGVESFAAFWSTNRRGTSDAGPTRRATFPSESEYAVVCRKLPVLMQKCMMTSYRDEHAQPCDAAAQHLRPSLVAKVDALFFDLPPGATSSDDE